MKATREVRHAELEMEGDVIQNEDGTIEFELKSVDGWAPPNLASRVAERSTNLPVYWRHRTPQKKEFISYPMIGHVMSSRVDENGAVLNRYKIGEDLLSPVQRNARDWILKRRDEGKKVGASIGATFFTGNDGEKVSILPFEYSITPDPACQTCVMEMAEEKTADEIQKDLDNPEVEKAKAIQQEIEKKMAELEALKADVLKEKAAIVEKEMALKEAETTKVVELQTKMAEMEASYKEQFIELERRPILAQLGKFDKVPTSAVMHYLEKECPQKLKALVEELEKQPEEPPAIVTMTVEKEKSEKLSKDKFMASIGETNMSSDEREMAWQIYSGA